VISGSNTGLFNPAGIAVDSSENIYVANKAPHTITIFAAGSSGNVTPTATIDTACQSNPNDPFRSGELQSIALDSKGNIFVSCIDPDAVNVFAAGSNGSPAPIASISGSDSGITSTGTINGLTVDSAGDIYVSNGPILIFNPGSNGDVAPARTIGGPHTPLALIGGHVAVQP
jgi:sugar lactone lactonase YvrE